MNNVSGNAWNFIDPHAAHDFLNNEIHPNRQSVPQVALAIKKIAKMQRGISIIELGCGNCSFWRLLKNILDSTTEVPLDIEYTGIDVSLSFLKAAKLLQTSEMLVHADICKLPSGLTSDIVILSHVMEMVESPELLLEIAKGISNNIIIRWFEPPLFDFTIVELHHMPHGVTSKESDRKYMRWKIGSSDYEHWLGRSNIELKERLKTPIKDIVDILKLNTA